MRIFTEKENNRAWFAQGIKEKPICHRHYSLPNREIKFGFIRSVNELGLTEMPTDLQSIRIFSLPVDSVSEMFVREVDPLFFTHF